MHEKMLADVIRFSKTKRTARAVLIELAALQDVYNAPVYPSLVTLAAKIGVTEQHVNTVIKALEKDGHISVERLKEPGKRPHNLYTVLAPWEPAQTITKHPAQIITKVSWVDKEVFPDLNPKKEKTPSLSPPEVVTFVKVGLGIDPYSPFGRVLCNGALSKGH